MDPISAAIVAAVTAGVMDVGGKALNPFGGAYGL